MSRSELLQLARSPAGVSENGLIVTGRTGVIAAGAGAMSIFWAFEPEYPSTILDTRPCVLERMRIQWTTITAFAVPVTAGREIALCAIDIMPAIGGSTSSIVRKQGLFGESGASSAARISNTAPLTPAGDAPNPNNVFARMPLAGFGAAGATCVREWSWNTGSAQMVQVPRDTPVAVICTNAMDAGGTFELVIEAEYQCVPVGWPVP